MGLTQLSSAGRLCPEPRHHSSARQLPGRGSRERPACREAAAAASASRTCHSVRCWKHLVKINYKGSTHEPGIKCLHLIPEEEHLGQTTCQGFTPTVLRSAGTFLLTSITAPCRPRKTFCDLCLLAPSHPTLLRCSERRSSTLNSRKLLMLFLSRFHLSSLATDIH